MSFCGFVSFSNSDEAEQAERAVRTWVSRTAAVRDDAEWTASTSRGWMSAFSLVANPAHRARLQRDPDGLLVGDVPSRWLAGHGARQRAAVTHSGVEGLADWLPAAEFAFARWTLDSSQLSLFRCHFGARALLYVHKPRRWLAFASLPEPLLMIPGVTTQIDEPTLAGQLINDGNRRQAPDATVFTHLRRVPPGHVLRFTQSAVSVDAYWRVGIVPPLDTAPDDPEIPRTLLRHLETAVHRRVTDITRVGTQMSGGLDSSAVTALAHTQRDRGAQLLTYTIRRHSREGELLSEDEHRLAELLQAELPGVEPRIVRHHRANRPYFLHQQHYLARPLPDMVFFLSAHDRLLEAARQDGCEVMLTGWGGDEMVSSRTRLHVLAMLTERRWRPALRNLMGHQQAGPLRVWWSHVGAPLRGALPRARWSAAADDAVRRIFGNKPLAPLVAPARWTRGSLSVRQHRLDALYRTGNTLMLEVQDWLGQRAGIAGAHPLFDRDVVAFANAMPAEWIADCHVRRRAFRTALTPVLSDAHRLREKTRRPGRLLHFGPVEHRGWLVMQRAIEDLARSGTWLHEYVNLAALVEATRARSIPERGDVIGQISAGVLVAARART